MKREGAKVRVRVKGWVGVKNIEKRLEIKGRGQRLGLGKRVQ